MIELAIIALTYVAFVAFHSADLARVYEPLASVPARLGVSDESWRAICWSIGGVLLVVAAVGSWLRLGAFVGLATTIGGLMVSGMLVVLAAPVARRTVFALAAACCLLAPALFIAAVTCGGSHGV